MFPTTATPESQNQQWRPPEKRRSSEARRVPKKRFNCFGSSNEISQKELRRSKTVLVEKKSVLPALPPKKQRPPQSLKRRAEPPKPESTKAIPKETKVAKGPVNTPGVHDNSAGPSRKPETKKQEEVKKPVPPPAPVVPPLKGGHYELNARMTKMVEVELRDIMIKVWHELPDNPSDEAEALVVDLLRNQAGDYLRNVLGLNITKRLLNVHNPLYVKVQFSGKPEKAHLGEFLKKYNFTAFKRIEKTVNMFAAQVKTINDFDRICSDADVRCGDIKVSVTPIYKFTKCPPNLVTSFYDQDEDASDEAAEKTEIEEKPENITSSEKVIAKTENVPTKPKEENKSENTTTDKVVNKPVENKSAMNKPAVKNTVKKTPVKPAAENTAVNKTDKKTPVKPAAENTAVNNTVKKSPVKPAAENTAVNKPTPEKPVSKPAAQNKTVTNTTADVKHGTTDKTFFNNASGNKTAVVKKLIAIANESAAVNVPADVDKTVAKPAAQSNEDKKPHVAPKTNVTAKKPAPSPAKTTGKTNKGDDYDELDDQDILALMSEGIVLDECSGSDEE